MKIQKLTPYLFLLPALTFFAIFVLFPMIWSLRLSFFEWKVVGESFVGFQNYANVLNDPIFYKSLLNTSLYVVGSVAGQVLLGLLFAQLLAQKIRGRTFFRTAYYIPVISSWAVVAVLWSLLLEPTRTGIVNYGLQTTGMISTPIPWLTTDWWARLSIILFCVWKGVGWATIIFLGAIQVIPQHLYEVADIDKTSTWRKFRHITLPIMTPIVGVVMAMLIIGAFNIFPQVYILTGGGPVHATESLLTWQYYRAFTELNFGYATAMGFLIVPLVLLITFINIRLVRRRFEY